MCWRYHVTALEILCLALEIPCRGARDTMSCARDTMSWQKRSRYFPTHHKNIPI